MQKDDLFTYLTQGTHKNSKDLLYKIEISTYVLVGHIRNRCIVCFGIVKIVQLL